MFTKDYGSKMVLFVLENLRIQSEWEKYIQQSIINNLISTSDWNVGQNNSDK